MCSRHGLARPARIIFRVRPVHASGPAHRQEESRTGINRSARSSAKTRSPSKKSYRRPGKRLSGTRCPGRGLLYLNGVWRWADVPAGKKPRSRKCPACLQIQDSFPGGLLHLGGSFLPGTGGRSCDVSTTRRRPRWRSILWGGSSGVRKSRGNWSCIPRRSTWCRGSGRNSGMPSAESSSSSTAPSSSGPLPAGTGTDSSEPRPVASDRSSRFHAHLPAGAFPVPSAGCLLFCG